ncbi:chemotaxis protein CheA [Phaeobacter gallaeciensis]|uniref:chemotaxis protein CheA n=1 Tax=Phaeobacter gallaeciensis TaxID=60890 RepID=UPI00237F3E2E|nr:chemotaxis protein CheA [Phaeobacter gallaeciensis]MDE4099153.1 chemotaxis protein CheA [Phaeobacter gallaeciensis]MDE4107981.1 chemotaxis protein CheA [Phaeobacter gallaeciensis]MDE4112417.1 chemotaxis protein CheA [Phaeobacter gallaeciensis]MDE4116906.1 chemotaxis protein CheA [Phaeobacter gallaeciensis]MDE4121360.1 chemotaxis protein CheA [Phaeobacter gallaeciensis]
MVQNNKVLTVSYGTFSCTLEGFEDSFGTMKAIAEYFRDLASDDRYFGAEPPQPDADMLARIAQREIARQVEARTSTEGIHLRAATAPQPAPAAEAAVSDAPTEEAQVRDTQKTDVEDTVAPPSEQSEPTENSAAEPSIEAPPAPQASADEAAEEPAKATDTDEADGDAATLVGKEQAQPPAPDADKIAAISAAAAAHDSEAEAAEDEDSKPAKAAEDESAEAEIAEPKAPKRDAAAAESIAAKLRRIRAVVSQTPQEDFSEDEHAESILSEAASDISEALAEDAAAEEAKADEDASNDDEISRVLAQLGKDNAEAEDRVADQPVVEAAVESEPEPAPETAPEQEPAQPEAQAEPEQAEPAAELDQAEPEAAEKPRRPMRARVIKVKRADLEQVVATGALTNLSASAEAEPATASATPGVDSSLSDEDEADLMRELAEVEAELLAASQETEEDRQEEQKAQTATTEESTADAEAAAIAEDAAKKRPAAPSADFPDSDVSRLMDAADAKLDAPETASSRETYGHLRAAVAAAEADRSAGGSAGSENSEDAYRQDLASVVKPRRPVPTGARSARDRSNASRPAPLKLVAEQRIDPSPAAEDNASGTPQATRPVRPRRISVLKDEGSASDATAADFAAYAAERGAVELQDLLEAAAAYMSFVEGRDHFSRPQLMNKVRDAGAAEFNREDGLRSFGQLLREGKIERSENGRFAATEETGFRPAKRAVG